MSTEEIQLDTIRTGKRYLPLLRIVNTLVAKMRRRSSSSRTGTVHRGLQEVRLRERMGTDISSHLETIFIESILVHPRLIVELGVREGESTYVFERVSRYTGCYVVGVDVDGCSDAPNFERRIFVQADSIKFGVGFSRWTAQHGLPEQPDIVFIDTSHLYKGTRQELDIWLPMLAPGGLAILHDTNLGLVYRRRDWTWGYGWDNKRGTIKAVEETFGESFNEGVSFECELRNGWLMSHHAYCNGLTILRKPEEGEACDRR